jgi:mRNA interferase MazF
MGPLTVGDIVLVAFPFADFTNFKKRPAIIVAKAEFDNLILCQITSKANTSKSAIQLTESDFRVGSLQVDCFIRIDKLFTIEKSVIKSHLGSLDKAKTSLVKKTVRELFI